MRKREKRLSVTSWILSLQGDVIVKWKLHSQCLINSYVNIVVVLKDTHNECQYLTHIFSNWTPCFKTNLRAYFKTNFSNMQVDAYNIL